MNRSDKLRAAFSDLQAVDEDVIACMTGVGTLPLPQATTRVSQAAHMAKTAALAVLEAAEAADAVATTAAATISAAEAAVAAATVKPAPAEAATEATEAAKTFATVSLKSEIDPSLVSDRCALDRQFAMLNALSTIALDCPFLRSRCLALLWHAIQWNVSDDLRATRFVPCTSLPEERKSLIRANGASNALPVG